ncbi:HalOD1 output domain-containing protein [Natrinema salinisoli]|uniref:HalOD1 output domain-containing protein n=1 Tax=Natrinema salinisoli TaxID=2878535 RepID=UPI001CF01CDC|nr:HalOD1 output domain-containing protein [Natrinema salinisoli]
MNKSSSGSVDSGTEPVSIAVVTAAATYRNADPTDLPPLYEWVDPDALDALFAPTQRGGSRGGRFEFTYDGLRVAVDCADDVSITIDGSPIVGAMEVDAGNDSTTGA